MALIKSDLPEAFAPKITEAFKAEMPFTGLDILERGIIPRITIKPES